jgi:hypothetical protein
MCKVHIKQLAGLCQMCILHGGLGLDALVVVPLDWHTYSAIC